MFTEPEGDSGTESNFQVLTMADVMSEFHDGPHATPPESETGPIYLGIKNLTPHGLLDLSKVRRISEEDWGQWTKRVTPQPGDIVFSYEATLHRYAIIPKGFRGCLGRRLALIRPDPTVVSTDFLMYSLLSPQWRATIESNINIGSTVDRIPLIEFPSYPVSVPALSVQKNIGRALKYFDNLIENNQRRIELLEETARLLYREWFVHFRYPGHEDVPLVDSGLGPIPQDWETRSFNEVADFINGFAFKSSEHWLEEGLPIIKIKELKAGLSDDTPRYHGNDIDTKYFIDNGDVLFSWSAHLDAYVWAGGPGLLNQHLFVVKPYELSKLFVFHSLRGQMTEFWARAQGTTMKHIKRSALGEVLLRVPPPEIRQQFEQTVGPMLDLQLELQSLNRLLTEIRDLLLPRLVSGDLDVSDLELDLEAVG